MDNHLKEQDYKEQALREFNLVVGDTLVTPLSSIWWDTYTVAEVNDTTVYFWGMSSAFSLDAVVVAKKIDRSD